MDKTIKVITVIDGVLKVDDKFQNTLESIQQTVGGCFEAPVISKTLLEHKIDVYINEEGKLINLPVSAILVTKDMHIVDDLRGNLIFVSHDEHGNTIGLSDEQIRVLKLILGTRTKIIAGEEVRDVSVIFVD